MRGTPRLDFRRMHPTRFIPAYAGNACRNCTRRSATPVHPRVCGERFTSRERARLTGGSSPRMRGTPDIRERPIGCSRFIPAYAGNASTAAGNAASRPVHPRVCGERGSIHRHVHISSGSSPRMRGTPPLFLCRQFIPRFIPAYAGNAEPSAVPCSTYSVHPRVCGERRRKEGQGSMLSGSSPRMRGTPRILRVGQSAARFIPAYAGNAS